MKKTANARFAIKSWDEKPYSEGKDVPKLTRASVVKTFTGDIEGEGRVEYLMMYRGDGSATFVSGGTLINVRRTNEFNWAGTGIKDGQSRPIAKGDFIMVPEGTPHWFSAIDGTIVLMSLHLPRAPKAPATTP